jgi:hypothetical protein
MTQMRDGLWRGIHLGLGHDAEVEALIDELPALVEMGLNVLVPEVNYQFAYTSHPELQGKDPITPGAAHRLAGVCRDLGVRLIPQFQCLGHQSWAETTYPLLLQYPEFDETPGQYPNNEDIYCRSWCPQHPDVNPIIFELFNELLEAFEADALHVGLDEVFLIGSDHCPRCKGHDPAELFAKAVNDYHAYLVGERGVEMLMWGDRLDMIPTDIIICDWHYELMEAYPSVAIFLEKGFRVLPGGWKDVEAMQALLDASLAHRDDPRMLGHLCTTWGRVRPGELAAFPPIRLVMAALM